VPLLARPAVPLANTARQLAVAPEYVAEITQRSTKQSFMGVSWPRHDRCTRKRGFTLRCTNSSNLVEGSLLHSKRRGDFESAFIMRQVSTGSTMAVNALEDLPPHGTVFGEKSPIRKPYQHHAAKGRGRGGLVKEQHLGLGH
jgi:hypothetical protein